MNIADITPLILTWNEEANISRVLETVAWASRIVVIDSGSTDETVTLVARFKNVRLIARPFDNHTAQWNYGLAQVDTPWVLSLDADYVCPGTLPSELSQLKPDHAAYRARFRYSIHGKILRANLYPPRVVLFQPERFRYAADGHTQRLDVSEDTGELSSVILHDDRKPLSRWLAAQARYADLEVKKLRAAQPHSLGWKDRLRTLIFIMPLLTAFYCFLFKALILDGWTGIYYTFQRVYAELLLSMKLLDAKLSPRNGEEIVATRHQAANDALASDTDREAIVPTVTRQ